MRSRLLAAAAAVLIGGTTTLVACRGDDATTPSPLGSAVPAPPGVALDRSRREAMTEQFARALADAGFRAQIRAALSASPVREHKLQFQRWMLDDPRHLRSFTGPSVQPPEAMQAEVMAAPALEFYFPVPGDLERWTGGTQLLVATTGSDHEAPVAFDVRGRRRLLDPASPPDLPVLALVPQETDFDAPLETSAMIADEGGAGNSGSLPPGLYLTQARYLQSFEGWLKGSPEFDIHLLGKAAGKDSLDQISCSGRTAAGYYRYRQTSLDWTGNALIYSTAQLEAFQAANPGEGFRIVVVEDDDAACVLRANQSSLDNTIRAIEAIWPQVTGGLAKGLPISKRFEAAGALGRFLSTIANFFSSSDDLVGNAIDTRVTGEAIPVGNWVVKGENAVTNGYLNLQMRN